MTESKIFHITSLSEVPSARTAGSYLPRGFDAEGFIHCSTRDQLIPTANRIFADQTELCVFEIDVAKVQPEIRYENLEGGEELYPHIYGALSFEAVCHIHPLPPVAGRFEEPPSIAWTGKEIAEWLRMTLAASDPVLRSLSSIDAARPPAPGKWSPKEVLGHLIDSASNNHGRFVRARHSEGLRHPGYDQDAWAEAGAYNQAPWEELVELWRLLNLQIARVVETTPAADLERARSDHNLDAIAWRTVPADEPVTLADFARDYIGHLRHHLVQIDPRLPDEAP